MIEPAMETHAYGFKKWRLAGLMIFGILVTLIAVLFCLAAPAFQHAWLIGIGGGLAILLFGGTTVFTARRLFSRRPGLVLDHEGIIDDSSYSSVGRIPWSAIISVRVVRPPGFRSSLYGPTIRVPAFLVLDVRDPQRFIDGSALVKRWLLRGNLASFGSPVAISPASVHIDADELAQYIRRIVGPS
jgi:hypothetical protein